MKMIPFGKNQSRQQRSELPVGERKVPNLNAFEYNYSKRHLELPKLLAMRSLLKF